MNTTDPEAPYGRDDAGNPLPAPEHVDELAARDEEIAQLRAELEAARVQPPAAELASTPAPVPPASSSIGVAPPTAAAQTDEEAGIPTTHAIAPGSTGPDVEKLAQLLEQAGEKTYLTDPTVQNYAHVFGDDLLEAVRRVLFDHPAIADAEGAERQRLTRWINGLELVTAEVWGLIGEVAEKAKAPAA